MGRYIERVENTARLLSVTERFATDSESGDAWRAILQVFDEEKNFKATGKSLTAENVARYFLSEKRSMSSIISTLTMVKENGRSLRHLISTEAWVQISRFHGQVKDIAKKKVPLSKLAETCEIVRSGCHEHYGVMESTLYRDEAWLFNRIGAVIERADQMTRLIDMKYFQIDAVEDGEETKTPDVVWWNTLLRSASGYHAFRRRHSFNPKAEEAAAFFLFDEDFPRSVLGSINHAFDCLDELEADYGAAPDKHVSEARAQLERSLAEKPEKLKGRALHSYIDRVQSDIISVSNAIANRYFKAM